MTDIAKLEEDTLRQIDEAADERAGQGPGRGGDFEEHPDPHVRDVIAEVGRGRTAGRCDDRDDRRAVQGPG